MIFKDRLDPVDSKTVGEIDKVILNAKNRNKKIIYCALSSLKAIEQTFLSKLVEVFRYEEEIQVIVGLGNKSQPPEGSLPENMRFFFMGTHAANLTLCGLCFDFGRFSYHSGVYFL